jgi:CheY-like chemotaxis protein
LGIGLALVRHLVVMHGGTVEAHSGGLGQGSEFEVRLPRMARAPVRTASAPSTAQQDGSGRVLVIDDDREGGESLKVLLELCGYEVRLANDLDSALAAAAALQPQLVLTDIAMPRADGYEVGRALRASSALTQRPIVVGMSGYGRASDFERSRAEGFAHHFVKPVDPAELDEVLRRLIQHSPDDEGPAPDPDA